MNGFCGIWKNKVHLLIIILNSMIHTSHAFELSEIWRSCVSNFGLNTNQLFSGRQQRRMAWAAAHQGQPVYARPDASLASASPHPLMMSPGKLPESSVQGGLASMLDPHCVMQIISYPETTLIWKRFLSSTGIEPETVARAASIIQAPALLGLMVISKVNSPLPERARLEREARDPDWSRNVASILVPEARLE